MPTWSITQRGHQRAGVVHQGRGQCVLDGGSSQSIFGLPGTPAASPARGWKARSDKDVVALRWRCLATAARAAVVARPRPGGALLPGVLADEVPPRVPSPSAPDHAADMALVGTKADIRTAMITLGPCHHSDRLGVSAVVRPVPAIRHATGQRP
jgi:hypothetical protein